MELSIWPRRSHDWPNIRRIATHAERSGWQGVWFPDHFKPSGGDLSRPVLECWATLSALAASVRRVRLGALVSGNTYRHPAVLANTATAADRVSGGRVPGYRCRLAAERARRLRHPLRDDPRTPGAAGGGLPGHPRLRDRTRCTFHGRYYRLEDAPMEPKPSGPLPLLVGGGGERRTIPIAARYADEWNVWGTFETFAHKARVLDRACEDVGRDPREVRRSTQALLVLAAAT